MPERTKFSVGHQTLKTRVHDASARGTLLARTPTGRFLFGSNVEQDPPCPGAGSVGGCCEIIACSPASCRFRFKLDPPRRLPVLHGHSRISARRTHFLPFAWPPWPLRGHCAEQLAPAAAPSAASRVLRLCQLQQSPPPPSSSVARPFGLILNACCELPPPAGAGVGAATKLAQTSLRLSPPVRAPVSSGPCRRRTPAPASRPDGAHLAIGPTNICTIGRRAKTFERIRSGQLRRRRCTLPAN